MLIVSNILWVLVELDVKDTIRHHKVNFFLEALSHSPCLIVEGPECHEVSSDGALVSELSELELGIGGFPIIVVHGLY